MSVVLRADSIGKAFGGRRVLSSAYFEVAAGRVTALLGRNGAGKSTLLKIAAGWLAPDHGFVELRGTRHMRPRAAELAREGLFYLSVDRSILSPVFTLGQHMDAMVHRFGAADRRPVLERLSIAHLVDVPTASLSGGERRRAELALALFRGPSCLLLDEPFRGIDPRDAEVVRAVVVERAREGCAVAFTAHEMGHVLGVADDVVWLREGTTQQLGCPGDAVQHWRFRRDYLGR
jgi:ABC-type multidrug transport system ATPase subunit